MEDVLMLIDRYGLPLIILLCLGYVIWKYLLPKLDDLWYAFLGQRDSKISVDEIFKADLEINNLLLNVLREAKADRALVWQFHNGGMSLNGIPFLRISATHEQATRSAGIAQLYQNLPTSLFTGGADCDLGVTKMRTICVAETQNAAFKGMMLAHKIADVCIVALRDSKGTLVGFLTVVYSTEQDFEQERLNTIEKLAERAQILLDIQWRVNQSAERR